jgi:aldehyde dehydrogenase (NAD+)
MENSKEVLRIFELQSNVENLNSLKNSSANERITKIKSILEYILNPAKHKLIAEALFNDLHKSNEEVITTEISPLILTIKEVVKKLKSWMKDEHVPSPITMTGMSSYIKYEGKGTVLILSPWNYPFQLTVYPLIYAIAAGNAVIIKPSEISSNTSSVINAMIKELFDENEVTVMQGNAELATELLKQPFNQIHFTGSPKVGKIVMAAAAKNLSGVTLELGGKSPVIIDETCNAKNAAEKIAWAKSLNSGQTCIAPDYALVQETKLEEFITAFEHTINKFYNGDKKGIQSSKDYGRIINKTNFKRIKDLVDNAISNGANIEVGGDFNEEEKFISPTLLNNVSMEMDIMIHEIFGPILPIISYKTKKDAIEKIQQLPTPLAFYVMSNKKSNINYFLNNTASGGSCINELMLTSVNPHLPFGVLNNSGIGKSNGKHSFEDFSNPRGIVKRNWGSLKPIYPPFNSKIFKYFKKIVSI